MFHLDNNNLNKFCSIQQFLKNIILNKNESREKKNKKHLFPENKRQKLEENVRSACQPCA